MAFSTAQKDWIAKNLGINNCFVYDGLSWRQYATDGAYEDDTGGTGIILSRILAPNTDRVELTAPRKKTFRASDVPITGRTYEEILPDIKADVLSQDGHPSGEAQYCATVTRPPVEEEEEEGGITIKTDKNQYTVGEEITISGKYSYGVGEPAASEVIAFTAWFNGAKISPVKAGYRAGYAGETKTHADGSYVFRFTPNKAGKWVFQAWDDYESSKVSVTVTSAPAGVYRPWQPVAPTPSGTCTQSFRVLERDTNKPIEGAIIRSRGIKLCTTDESGRCTAELEQGKKYSWDASKRNYVPVKTSFVPFTACAREQTGYLVPYSALFRRAPTAPTRGAAATICDWIDEIGVGNLTRDHALYVYYLARGETTAANFKYDRLSPKPSQISSSLATKNNALGIYYYSRGEMIPGNIKTGCNYS